MSKFAGFSEKQVHKTSIPEVFFHDVLPDIDHLGELKVTLYLFWRFSHMESVVRFLQRSQILKDQRFMAGMGATIAGAIQNLEDSLDRSVHRGTLIKAEIETRGDRETLYFINSPKSRAAVDAIKKGEWRFPIDTDEQLEPLIESPTIFRLYEDNIGPLTPLIADAIGDAQDDYPEYWIAEAIQIAAEKNIRNWRYIEAILKRWYQEGKHDRRDQEDSEKSGRKYIEGDYSDFVEH
jgi:DnaD/phage-associated family protein